MFIFFDLIWKFPWPVTGVWLIRGKGITDYGPLYCWFIFYRWWVVGEMAELMRSDPEYLSFGGLLLGERSH